MVGIGCRPNADQMIYFHHRLATSKRGARILAIERGFRGDPYLGSLLRVSPKSFPKGSMQRSIPRASLPSFRTSLPVKRSWITPGEKLIGGRRKGRVNKVGDPLKCSECSSSKLRPSRFRLKDVEHLLLLQYPIRCRRCFRRDYASFQQILWQTWKARSKAPEGLSKGVTSEP